MNEGETPLDRFTERAKRVLQQAREEAQRFNHNYLGTEHLLLGLFREREGIAARALAELGVGVTRVREEIELMIGRGNPGDGSEGAGLTPRARRVLDLAREEADRLSHRYVGTEHLLLALLREGEGIAAQILRQVGVERQQAENLILRLLRPLTPGSGPTAPRDNVVTCRVDDRDLEAIDALIEAGLRTTRSDAASWLIRAGIEANAELFEKVYATVGEIRRLRREIYLTTMAKPTSGAAAVRPAPPAEPVPGERAADEK